MGNAHVSEMEASRIDRVGGAIGAVPLPVLEQHMAQFIPDGGENPSPQADERGFSAP